jgi:hypothetical protein
MDVYQVRRVLRPPLSRMRARGSSGGIRRGLAASGGSIGWYARRIWETVDNAGGVEIRALIRRFQAAGGIREDEGGGQWR